MSKIVSEASKIDYELARMRVDAMACFANVLLLNILSKLGYLWPIAGTNRGSSARSEHANSFTETFFEIPCIHYLSI